MKTINTALCMLRVISDHGGEISVGALSEKMGLDKAKVHRNLRALVEQRFVEQNPETKSYRLGLALVELAGVRLRQMHVYKIAPVYMTQLWDKTNETVQLSILRDGFLIFLHVIESTHGLRFSSRVGDRIKPYYSAAGKLLLAYQADAELESFDIETIERMTPRTIVDPEKLKRELRQIREQGFAIDNEGWITGLSAVAAPIRNATDEVVAAIATGGPTSRVSKDRLQEMRELLEATATNISTHLGWSQKN